MTPKPTPLPNTISNVWTVNLARQTFKPAPSILAKLARPLFEVEPSSNRFLVIFRDRDEERMKEIKRWFAAHGHLARRHDPSRLGFGGAWYVKCSKDIALLAKLTFGGA